MPLGKVRRGGGVIGCVKRLTPIAALLVGGSAALLSGTAVAANRPDYRDCSFSGGLDPDFVQLTGATAGNQGTLTVSPSHSTLQVTASESSDPGDSLGSDTLSVTVSSPGTSPQTVMGAGVGKVTLTAPLSGAAPGKTYMISWAATFDNGNHMCPSSSTPQNTSPQPFVVKVSGTSPAPPPTKLKRHCHKRTKRVHGHKKTVLVCKRSKKH